MSEEEDVDGEEYFPGYWFHTQLGAKFHDTYPAESFQPVIQALMDSSWADCHTIDRRGTGGLPVEDPIEDVPMGLRVLKVLRVEDSGLWSQYVAMQDDIRESRRQEGLLKVRGVATVEGLPLPERRRLEEGINEVYLWHASSPERVTSIASNGFPVQLRSYNHGCFGDGAYMLENSSHADEYAEDDKDGYYQGYYAMLLCRVTLGKAQVLSAADGKVHARAGRGFEFDSTIGQVPAYAGERLREFVVPDPTQIYPEYAIIYERTYRRPRVR